MDPSVDSQSCHCHCGESAFTVQGRPLLRFICHCRICQAFNKGPYGDVTVFRRGDVTLPEGHRIEFQTYRPPPNVQRGKCPACDRPVVEFLNAGPLPGLAIVPSANFPDPAVLPGPALHIFYDRRVADAEDSLPRYSGYWSSELALGRRLMGALLKRS